jgi:hypothetical protein
MLELPERSLRAEMASLISIMVDMMDKRNNLFKSNSIVFLHSSFRPVSRGNPTKLDRRKMPWSKGCV